MARYIDIEGAGIGKANREQFLVPEFADGWNAVLKILEKEPTADVEEVKHGEWVTVYSENGYHKECSVCGSRWMLDSKEHVCKETKRCYECGAKMDGRK